MEGWPASCISLTAAPSPGPDKFARLANAYLANDNRAKTKKVVEYYLRVMPNAAIPCDYCSPQLVPALVAGGTWTRADEILDTRARQAQQVVAYAAAHPDGSMPANTQSTSLIKLQSVYQSALQVGDATRAQQELFILQPYRQASQGQ